MIILIINGKLQILNIIIGNSFCRLMVYKGLLIDFNRY